MGSDWISSRLSSDGLGICDHSWPFLTAAQQQQDSPRSAGFTIKRRQEIFSNVSHFQSTQKKAETAAAFPPSITILSGGAYFTGTSDGRAQRPKSLRSQPRFGDGVACLLRSQQENRDRRE
ncbi:hypothetical protein KSP39_PZI019899 [Platanthera zijinensis]|uniref:Uncharacterized protein n=1 Tax=Platanthera zijinensis TaxID=2320716 RepID=A0AAP0AZK5_9ASPA